MMIEQWHWVWPGVGLGLKVMAKALITRLRPAFIILKARPIAKARAKD